MSLENISQNEVNPVSSICWSAIGGGALIAFGLTLIFNLLFVSLGLGLNDSTMVEKENITFIASIFYILGGFMLLFVAGIITGKIYKSSTNKLSTRLKQEEYRDKRAYFSAMHGFIAWVLYLIINLTFLSLLSQATPIESPFMYVNNNAAEQINKDKPLSISNIDGDTESVTSELSNKEMIEAAQTGAMIIFIIFTSGAIAFVVGSYRGYRSSMINIAKLTH